MVSTKEKAKAEAEKRNAARAQRELEVFGEVHKPRHGHLVEYEMWWSQHYEWLKEQGFLLRPRYAPDWVPSWKEKNPEPFFYEDARGSEVSGFNDHLTHLNYGTKLPSILDATRLSDGAYVVLKIISKSVHPYEVEIGRFFSSDPLRSDPANHCIPIYDVLSVPDDKDKVIIIMPLLREYTSPSFGTIGEVVECFRQLFEVSSLNVLEYILYERTGSAIYAQTSSCPSVRS